MPMKFDVSFKNTKKDKELYNYFYNLEDRSYEVKAILKDWYDKNVKCIKHEEVEKENLDCDITDF